MPHVPEFPVYPVLQGKVALVTGGAQGMGRATAELFLKAGAKVVIADVQADKGEAAAAELSKLGDVIFIQTDISSSEQVQNLVNKTVEKYGALNCAVNNAALTPDGTPLTDFDEDYWTRLVGINLTGTALCCKYEMRAMIAAGIKGSIVNIASINAFRPQPNMPAYTSTKHALIGLTKHASSEGGPKGIRINAIAPGAIYVSYLPFIPILYLLSYCLMLTTLLLIPLSRTWQLLPSRSWGQPRKNSQRQPVSCIASANRTRSHRARSGYAQTHRLLSQALAS